MKVATIIVLLCLVATSVVYGENLETVTKKASGDSVKIVDAELKLAVGQFDLFRTIGAGKDVAVLNGTYDEDKFRYDFDFDPKGLRADLSFSSEMRGRLHTNYKDTENHWEIALSRDVELRLHTEIGAAEADFDFGDLALSELRMDVGAADARVDFSTVNKTTLNDFRVEAGACKLEMLEIGNSRFDQMKFAGGVGSFTLDFSGQFDYRAEADIEVGLGSIEIIVPSEIGVRLKTKDNFLSSIDFPERHLRRVSESDDNDIFETDNFGSAKGKLVIDLSVGMGSAKIKFR